MEDEEVMQVQQTQAVSVFEESEDPSMVSVVTLPEYADLTDQKVIRAVKDVFKGFDGDVDHVKFETPDQLGSYMLATMDDIRRVRHASDATQFCVKGAVMARFWCMGNIMAKQLADGGYGSGAVNKLAAIHRKSPSYIYQIKDVGLKLTMQDCYLLGMRGLDSTHLRKLAQIKDDSIRRSIIEAFVTMYKDTSDPSLIENARKQFVAALNADQQLNAVDIGTSDPNNGGGDEDVTPEWSRVRHVLDGWSRLLKKPASEDYIEDSCNALEDFFLSDSVPDAQERLDELKEEAARLRTLAGTAANNLDDLIKQLDSIQAVELNSSEA